MVKDFALTTIYEVIVSISFIAETNDWVRLALFIDFQFTRTRKSLKFIYLQQKRENFRHSTIHPHPSALFGKNRSKDKFGNGPDGRPLRQRQEKTG